MNEQTLVLIAIIFCVAVATICNIASIYLSRKIGKNLDKIIKSRNEK